MSPGAPICSAGERLKAFHLLDGFPDLRDFFVPPADPRVRQYLLERDPLRAVFLQQTCYEVFGLCGHELPDFVPEGHRIIDGLAGCLLVVIGIIGEHPAKQNVDDDAHTPQVDILPVGSLQKHLGGNIRLFLRL